MKPLYHRNKDGSVTWWKIEVTELGNKTAEIVTQYGKIPKGSKANKPSAIISTRDLIINGKNKGRSNETTPYEQALKEAESTYREKVEKGYSDKLKSVDDGPGYIEAMLAHDFHKEKKLPEDGTPVWVQPKMDGMRCIAVRGKTSEDEDPGFHLYSRTGKEIPGAFEIKKSLDRSGIKVVLDGELYIHGAHLEEILSILRGEEMDEERLEGAKKVEFWVFDIVDEGKTFTERYSILKSLDLPTNVKLVPTKRLKLSRENLEEEHANQVRKGFEGIMVRLPDTGYEHSRSHKLLKYKMFIDKEFKIVGYKEGRGKLMGHIAVFELEMEDGKRFEAKPIGSLDNLKKMFKSPEKYIGKWATVKFQDYTKKGVPHFGVITSVAMTEMEEK